MKYESDILKRLIDTYGVVGNPQYMSEIIKEFIVQGKECFPNLFTYQSDWLAHIDEFGLKPSYTVSYTGQSIYAPNTLEKPVKSAILKGQTLDSLVDFKDSFSVNNNVIDFDFLFKNKIDLTYTLVINITEVTSRLGASDYIEVRGIREDNTVVNIKRLTQEFAVGTYSIDFTFNEVFSRLRLAVSFNCVANAKLKGELYSVKLPCLTTTGKNLFNPNAEFNMTDGTYGFIKLTNNKNNSISVVEKDSNVDMSNIFFGLTRKGINATEGYNWLHNNSGLVTTEITNSPYGYFSFHPNNKTTLNKILQRYDIQFECSVTTTSYEPYKSNILTVNEDIELRGIGDVQDTLDCLSGEVTQRIGEINTSSLNESHFIGYALEPSGLYRMTINVESLNVNGLIECDKLPVVPFTDSWDLPYECVALYSGGILLYLKDTPTVESFVNKAIGLDLIIQYVKSQNSVKTVDLTILDQNGQNVKQLMAFNGGTHFVTGSFEGSPLPTVSVDVETDLEETLMACSLEGYTM